MEPAKLKTVTFADQQSQEQAQPTPPQGRGVRSTDQIGSGLLTGNTDHNPNVKTPHHRIGALNPELLRETEKFLSKMGKQVINQIKGGVHSLWKASKSHILQPLTQTKGLASNAPVMSEKPAELQSLEIEKKALKMSISKFEVELTRVNEKIQENETKLVQLKFDAAHFKEDVLNKDKEELNELNTKINQGGNAQADLIDKRNACQERVKSGEEHLAFLNKKINDMNYGSGFNDNALLKQQKSDLEEFIHECRSKIELTDQKIRNL